MPRFKRKKITVDQAGRKHGFRSGLEEKIIQQLKDAGLEPNYEGIKFDYRSRERAIAEVFRTTTNPEVKQVLRFAMELQNQYRSEAMNLYTTLSKVNDQLELLSRSTQNNLIDVYL